MGFENLKAPYVTYSYYSILLLCLIIPILLTLFSNYVIIIEIKKINFASTLLLMNPSRQSLRLNVGFLIHQSVGSSRVFYFDLPTLFVEPDLNLNNLTGSAKITRTPQGLLVQVKLQASMITDCVRCLTSSNQLLNTDFTELFAFTDRTASESGLILPEDGYIDLGPLVREYMVLEIPINPLCNPDCHGICPVCGEAQGDQVHYHEKEVADPRLAVLKTLLENQSLE
jgi:uncharacterized protein